MTSDKSVEEMVESLNGFDEIAIERAFGEVISLGKDKPMTLLRALVFTAHRREGLPDKDAKQAAMEATIRDLNDYFRPDEDFEAGEA